MLARIVLVLSEPGFADRAAAELVRRGYDALGFEDPMLALDALEDALMAQLLVTCDHFAPNKPTGLSLARMARFNRPGTKVLFVGSPEFAHYMEGLGAFLPSPVTEDQVVDKAIELVTAGPDGHQPRSGDKGHRPSQLGGPAVPGVVPLGRARL